jgi:hypothetical protein
VKGEPCTQAARLRRSSLRRLCRSTGTILSDFVFLFSPISSYHPCSLHRRLHQSMDLICNDLFCFAVIRSSLACWIHWPITGSPSADRAYNADCRYASVRLGGIVRSCSGRGCLNSCLFAIGICGPF